MGRSLTLFTLILLAAVAPLAAQGRGGRESARSAAARGTPLYDRVVGVLARSFRDSLFRTARLPHLADSLRPPAAGSLAVEREAVHRLLSLVPSSHLALLSQSTRAFMMNEMVGRRAPTLGLQLVSIGGHCYASSVLDSGPAARAGISPWDRIDAVEGVAPALSPRLDWRSDDAFLSDDRDPPVHLLLAREGERVTLQVERRAGETRSVTVPAEPWSALAAARAGARLVERDGRRLGYVHLWYLHVTGVSGLLRDLALGRLRTMEALVLDLRGRGGSASAVHDVLRFLEPGPAQVFDGPVVALVDRLTRSGKEVLAWELRRRGRAVIVGEPTAGAVVPGSFADVGSESVLMFPSRTMPEYTALLELRPMAPDLPVAWGAPLSGDRDPILEAGLDEAARRAAAAPRPARVTSGQRDRTRRPGR